VSSEVPRIPRDLDQNKKESQTKDILPYVAPYPANQINIYALVFEGDKTSEVGKNE